MTIPPPSWVFIPEIGFLVGAKWTIVVAVWLSNYLDFYYQVGGIAGENLYQLRFTYELSIPFACANLFFYALGVL